MLSDPETPLEGHLRTLGALGGDREHGSGGKGL